ncbi:hypothetical protein MSC49_27030 [Methylosinus sp. C49]|uniref:DUF3592 domain-containing protein n=1 Tax=Methylosinus sp. C49 TaxID=2699395 RepID=UPI001366D430|nr:DUF3592 domain-containing protein [Methylosinus sp. C49]BBU62768.1 hypothetical protein MSC49_27030 [Methylosinus sp. C49]
MSFQSVHHIFVIPGCLLLVLAAFNLLRYRHWGRVTGTIVERQTLPGEIIEDKIEVAYVISDRRYVSDVQQTFGQVRIGAEANDEVEISYDPLNPSRCMAYAPTENICTVAIAIVMILV